MSRKPQRIPSGRDDENAPLLPTSVAQNPPSASQAPSILNGLSQTTGPTQANVSQQTPLRAGKSEQPRAPKRTTKTSQKLTLFPEDAVKPDIEDVATLDTLPDKTLQLPHVTAKTRQEQWMSKLEKSWLPRVTAYCTANSYKMDALYDWLTARSARNSTAPKKFDEVIYTPYTAYPTPINVNGHETPPDFADLIDWHGSVPRDPSNSRDNSLEDHAAFFEQNVDAAGRTLSSTISHQSLAKRIAPVGECLFFDYGVVVMWGLTEVEEQGILKELTLFEEEKLAQDDVEVENFHFHYNTHYQPRIYNDIITLKNPANYMIKLTISHAIAQSVKLALFEGLIETTIESTKHIPQIMAATGKIHMSRKAINKKIGQLFIMRINVNLVSNVLDIPEIFWSEPALEPLYMAIRGYLEISQRVDLINQRVSVISDLLDMLKEHLTSSHGEQLEWIVIILIGIVQSELTEIFPKTEMTDTAFEIIIGIVTISFDLSSYLQHTGSGGNPSAVSSLIAPALGLPTLD
ncbi:hypothetical protein HK104_007291 [Borealophlyctis nickersoniae]|nr:hypothetical protein HK104_007291 [Borealophlyctis nickersoniae]